MRNKIIIYLSTVLLLIFSIFFIIRDFVSKEIIPFYITVTSGEQTQQINCWKNEDNEYFVFLPSFADLSQVQIHLNTEISLNIDDKTLTDGMYCDDFELQKPYSLTYTSWGKSYRYNIIFLKSDGIATMYIDTESGNMDYIHSDKNNSETGNISLYNADGILDYMGDLESISGRGNATWTDFDKKPYNITLDRDGDLLGMGQAQRWILLSNAADFSNLRNKIAYDFASKVGLAFSPDSQWVDLYLNSEYVGLYLLCERNEVNPNRVDVAENGSFLLSLEMKSRLEEQNYSFISTTANQSLRIHYPMETSPEYLQNLTETWQSVENAILAVDGLDPVTGKSWLEMIDLDSWVKKYLMEEVFGNYDACAISQFFYCDGSDEDGKIFAGPIWDFDNSMGRSTEWQLINPCSLRGNQLFYKNGYETPWFYSLYKKNEFYDYMVEMYKEEFLPLLQKNLTNSINGYAKQISQVSFLNQIRWQLPEGDIFAQAEYISSYMSEKVDFLNEIWVNSAEYHTIIADGGFGMAFAHYSVLDGECLSQLYYFPDTEFSVFEGWYYVDTDEPFDINKPINEDIAIYAKWQDSTSNKLDNIIKLIPLGAITVLFVIIFIIAIKRVKKGWVT